MASTQRAELDKGNAITDDETTSHDDTTTHERRRHQVKPLILGASQNAKQSDPGGRSRSRTLRSAERRLRRPRWIWWVAVACIAGGALVAWRTLASRPHKRTDSSLPSATQTASAADSGDAPPISKLSLDVHVNPSSAKVQIDGRPIEKTEGVEIELPCPNGFHQLRIDADNHDPVVKRIPCEGRIVMDIALDER